MIFLMRVVTVGFVMSFMAVSLVSAVGKKPVLLELFTSQGCSSCPAADKILVGYSKDKNVIPLSFHVDYWDYIGWKDTFASKVTTARQYAYAKALGQRNVYTPQMVVAGRQHVVGSDKYKIQDAISSANAGVSVDANISIKETGKALAVEISMDSALPYEAWIFAFDKRHEVVIRRGENSGQKLTYDNVVRDVRLLGKWAGGDKIFEVNHDDISMEKRDGYVIVVQGVGLGPVLAAARHWLK